MTAEARHPGKERGLAARHPWLTFLLAGVAPALLLSGNVLSSTVSLAALFPAFAAALVASDGDVPVPLPGDRARRLLLAAGVCVVLAEVRLAETGFAALPYTALVSAVPVALTAWVLSGAYAPSPGFRALVRPLAWARGSRAAWLVAALAWPAATAVAVAAAAALPGVDAVSPLRASAALPLTGWVVTGVVSSALVAVGWYGFAARRALPRLGPLVTGLLVGAAQWLVVWGTSLRPDDLTDRFLLAGLSGSVATGIAGVWVLERSRGSLLPVWILETLLVASGSLAYLAVLPGPGRAEILTQALAATRIAVALALVVAGRMWRRPAAAEADATSEPSSV